MRYIYLENTTVNHNKFYEMTGNPGAVTFKAKWGKIGKGPQGEQDYSMSDWYTTIDKKKKKGYLDMTHTVPPPAVPFEVNQEHLAKVNLIIDALTINRTTITDGQKHLKHVIDISNKLQDSESRLNGSLTKANMIYLNDVWQTIQNLQKTK